MSSTATFTPTAATVAAAETELTYAERAAAEAEAAVNVLRKRIANSNAAKTEIAARRNVGDCRDSDAGDVALLDLDREVPRRCSPKPRLPRHRCGRPATMPARRWRSPSIMHQSAGTTPR